MAKIPVAAVSQSYLPMARQAAKQSQNKRFIALDRCTAQFSLYACSYK